MIDLFDISQSNERHSQGVIKGFVKSFCRYKSLACFGSSASSVRPWGVMLKPDLREESQVTFLWDHKRYNFRPAAELKMLIWTLRGENKKKAKERDTKCKREERSQVCLNVSFCICWCGYGFGAVLLEGQDRKRDSFSRFLMCQWTFHSSPQVPSHRMNSLLGDEKVEGLIFSQFSSVWYQSSLEKINLVSGYVMFYFVF